MTIRRASVGKGHAAVAVLGSVGWQQRAKFGLVQLGVDNTINPTNITTDLDFDDTWHVAAALGGRGDLVGFYDSAGAIFLAGYFNWQF